MNTDAINIAALLLGLACIVFNKPLGRLTKTWQEIIAAVSVSERVNSIAFVVFGVLFILVGVIKVVGGN